MKVQHQIEVDAKFADDGREETLVELTVEEGATTIGYAVSIEWAKNIARALEFYDANKCQDCSGVGYHIDANLNGLVGEDENTIVVRCDNCQQFETDHEAALKYCEDKNTNIRGIVCRKPFV